jgi:hypothetical protein
MQYRSQSRAGQPAKLARRLLHKIPEAQALGSYWGGLGRTGVQV